MQYEGFDSAELQDGAIAFSLSDRRLTESIPMSWTLPEHRPVEVRYEVIKQCEGSITVGLKAADPSALPPHSALVIDPIPDLEWSSYYGGEGFDDARAITTDTEAKLYVAGTTNSFGNIATESAYETVLNGLQDVFVMKVAAHGSDIWTTYYGGEGWDEATGISVDPHDHVQVVGNTTSPTGISTPGTYQDTLAGDTDAFIVSFDSVGVRIWGTYLGGTEKDSATACRADGRDGLIIVGTSRSPQLFSDSLPPVLPYTGGADAFVARIDSAGHPTWSTWFGGTGDDDGTSVMVDSSGIWVAGYTASPDGIATPGAFQDSLRGAEDAFVLKLDTVGAQQWSSYFGSDATDRATGITSVGSAAFISGWTTSDSLVAATDTLSHQPIRGGMRDAFIARIDSGGSVHWATYLGDPLDDRAVGIARDKGGYIDVIGTTLADSLMATPDAYAMSRADSTDLFITRFDTLGAREWGTYFGGDGADAAAAITVFDTAVVYFAGHTSSTIDMAMHGVRLNYSGGGSDAIIGRFIKGQDGNGNGQCTQGTIVGPDTVYLCPGDTLALVIDVDSFPPNMDPMWYAQDCGDPRYFVHYGFSLSIPIDSTTMIYLRGENAFDVTNCIGVLAIVEPYPTPFATGPPTACLGDSVQFFASGGQNYSWLGPDSIPNPEPDPWITPVTAGDPVIYHVAISSTHGCSVSDSVAVSVLPSPAIDAQITDVSCFGDTDGSIVVSALDTLPQTYVWAGSNTYTDSLIGLTAGPYVLVTSNAQCSRTDTLTVGGPTNPIDSLLLRSATCGNANGTATVFTNDASAPYTFTWDVPGWGNSVNDLPPGTYGFTLTDSLGCAYAETFTITDQGSLHAAIDPDQALINHGDSLMLQGTIVPMDSGTVFTWSPVGSLSCSDCLSPFATPDSTMWYAFTATSLLGCTSTDSLLVVVDHPCPQVFVPSIFSPNNDGLNDMLCVMGGCIQTLMFTIYDRWGTVVFSSTGQGQCWDGSYHGHHLNGGAFAYTLNAVLGDGTTVQRTGNITIQR
jgi:gliding motility-associated-like protein